MNNVDQYIDFLDNKLDSVEEQNFAENFAIDKDFRLDFKKYLFLTKALAASSDFYAPTSVEKNAIFASIGFKSGASEIPTIKPKKADFFKGKFFTIFATAITTFFLTALMYQLFDKNEDLIKTDRNYSVSSSKSINQNVKKTPYATDIRKSNVKLAVPKPSSKLLAFSSDDASANASVPEHVKKEIIELSRADFQNENLLALAQKKNQTDINKVIIPDDNNFTDTIFLIRSYDSKIRFEFKNTPSWYSQNPSIQPSRQNNFNNLSVSFYYPVYKTLLLGADFRQETFYVEYEGLTSKGMDSKFYQHPNLSTYGLSLRFTPFNIGNDIKPFAQIYLGGNNVGVISREMLGIEYYPFENVYFLFGGELNQFYFTHNNTWFNSNKYSFNYGIGVKF